MFYNSLAIEGGPPCRREGLSCGTFRALLPVFACLLALFTGTRAKAATIEVDAGIPAGSCCVFQTVTNVPGVGTNKTTINVGDTVHWVWKANFHSVTSDTGAWTDSGVHNSGFTFDHTFNTAGTFGYHCSIHGGVGVNMFGTITVVAPTATVTGKLALDGVPDLSATNAGAPLGTFKFDFRTPGTQTSVFTANVTLTPVGAGSPFGTYSVTGVPPGTYDIAIKGGKNLRVVKAGVAVSGTTTLSNTTLPAGDTNNDNMVDVADFGTLVNAYNGLASTPGTGYDPQADFNFDGTVDVADFGILVNNYGLIGDL